MVPENLSAMYILGWLPENTIYAPGLFGDTHTKNDWLEFIHGTEVAKKGFLTQYPAATQLLILPSFIRIYAADSYKFIASSCFTSIPGTPLFTILCP